MPAKIAHPFQPVDLNRDRCAVAACYATSAEHPFVPFDDTANHHTGHHDLRAQHLDGWTCRECTAESHIRLAAVDDVPGIPTTPELDALAAEPLDDDAVAELVDALATPGEHFGPAERIPVRPAGSLPDPYPDELPPTRDERARVLWSQLLALANQDRRARARLRSDLAGGDPAADACRWGIVPCHGYRGDGRQREAAGVFGSWRHLADAARQLRALYAATGTPRWAPVPEHDAPITPGVYRGSDAAERDAGDERYNLAATGGRWYHVLPPIYQAGADTGNVETLD